MPEQRSNCEIMSEINNYSGLDLLDLALSLICGAVGGAIPALYAFTATGASTVFAHIFLLAISVVLTVILLRSSYPMRTVIQCGTSIVSYIFTLILGFYCNLPGKIFALLNPEYVKAYGRMNAGDGLGFIVIFLPLSIVILIIGNCISGFSAAIKSIIELRRNKKD